jgi:uncharacterized membrane protein
MDQFEVPAGSPATPVSDPAFKKNSLLEAPINEREEEEGKLPSMLGYVPFLFFVPLFGAKKNRFAVRHGQQAFALFIIEMVALLFLIDEFSDFVWTVVFVACLGLALVGCVHAAQGKFWKIPYLSDLVQKYDLFGGN